VVLVALVVELEYIFLGHLALVVLVVMMRPLVEVVVLVVLMGKFVHQPMVPLVGYLVEEEVVNQMLVENQVVMVVVEP
jgi:hypothetical protein